MAGPNYSLIPNDWTYLEYVINDLCSRIIDEDTSFTDYILKDGSRAFTGVVSGITPTANAHLSTKAYVDTAVAGSYAFKTITGITSDVVADSAGDTLTLASANARLTIVGTAATDTITFTVDTDLHNYSWTNVNAADLKTGSVTQAYNSYLTAINQALTTGSSPTFAGLTISSTNKLYFGGTNEYIAFDGDRIHFYSIDGYIRFDPRPIFANGWELGIDSFYMLDDATHPPGFAMREPGEYLINLDIKAVYSNQIEDTDFDLNEVISTGIIGHGLLIIYEIASLSESAIYHINGTSTPVFLSGNPIVWGTSKDTATKINVYYETNQIKVQNKISNNFNVRVGFFGV